MLDFVEAKQRQPEVEAKITALSGRLFRLEGDDEVWTMLEEDAFEWSAQYKDHSCTTMIAQRKIQRPTRQYGSGWTAPWSWWSGIRTSRQKTRKGLPQPVRGRAPGRERGGEGRVAAVVVGS